MTDETRADRTEITEAGIAAEEPLLHVQDDPVAAAAVDLAVETELLERDDLAGRAAAEAELLAAKRESERQIAALDAKDADRVRKLQGELRALNADVWPLSRWWGFEIHLNETAAVRAGEISALIGEIAGRVLGAWLTPIVERSARNKARWIGAVAQSYGIKLVSPWTAPAALVPTRLIGEPAGDARLSWTVHEPDQGWSREQRFVEQITASDPAVAEYKDQLYIVHRGNGDDAGLRWTVYDPEEGWSADQRFPQHVSDARPALAAYDGRLYCVHRGNGDDDLWWTRWDGAEWTPDARLPEHASASSPALAAYDGALYCVHRGNRDDNLRWTRWDGAEWSPGQRFPNHTTRSNPALAVFRGHLYCVHLSSGDDTALWWTRWDGANWSADQRLPGHSAAEGPALTVYKDRLYCVHRDASDESLWWSSFDGSSWSTGERLSVHRSAEAPAAIAYRDRNATRDQLLVIHRGGR